LKSATQRKLNIFTKAKYAKSGISIFPFSNILFENGHFTNLQIAGPHTSTTFLFGTPLETTIAKLI